MIITRNARVQAPGPGRAAERTAPVRSAVRQAAVQAKADETQAVLPDLRIFFLLTVPLSAIAQTLMAVVRLDDGYSISRAAATSVATWAAVLAVTFVKVCAWHRLVWPRLSHYRRGVRECALVLLPFLLASLAAGVAALWISDLLTPATIVESWLGRVASIVTRSMVWCGAGWGAWYAAKAWARRREDEAELRVRLQALERSLRRIIESQEEVRKTMADHLHGRVQNRLITAAAWLREAMQKGDGAGANQEMVSRAARIIEDVTQNDLRFVAHQLHPAILRLGFIEALRSLVSRTQGVAKVDLSVDDCLAGQSQARERALPSDLQLAVYRVVQEALTNAVKHGRASAIAVALRQAGEGSLRVTIEDDGQGFDVKAVRPGFGILSMQDYCDALGGRVAIASVPGRGTTVTATFSGLRETACSSTAPARAQV